LNKYHPERIHKRVDYVQHLYWDNELYSLFEGFIYAIAVYGRDGIIEAANRKFRDFTKIRGDEIQLKKINIFDYIDDTNVGLVEAAHNAFDGKESVYIGDKRLINAKADSPEDYLLSQFPNAIFFPMAHDRDGISLVGILLDRIKSVVTEDDTEDDI